MPKNGIAIRKTFSSTDIKRISEFCCLNFYYPYAEATVNLFIKTTRTHT